MRVLSLFDGMACGMLAMQAAGIPVDRYVAFEIDKYAIQTSSHNFPMIEHRGDVFQADFTEFFGFDFLVGGSPCTYWSIAQKNNRETEASGMGWELFCQYVRALHEAKPKWFIYENNKSMSKAIRQSITETFGFEPICINSALVSAQNRQRLYWVGKRNPDGTYSKVHVEQPEDRGILLRDVLDGMTDREKGRCVLTSIGRTTTREYFKKDQGTMAYEPVRIPYYGNEDKARPLGANYPNNCGGFEHRMFSDNPSKQQVDMVAHPVRVGTFPNDAKNQQKHDSQQYRIYSTDAKGVTLCGNGGGMGAKTGLYAIPLNTTATGKSQTVKAQAQQTNEDNIIRYAGTTYGASGVAEPVYVEGERIFFAFACEWDQSGKPIKAVSGADGKTYTVYQVKDGQITIKGKSYPIKLADGFYIIRKLTVSECKRLQTVPEWYEFPVSDAQSYKMLGNGWTVLIISHLIQATQNDVVVSTQNDASDCEQMNIFEMVEGGDDMSYFRTGDPLDDFNRLDREQAEYLESLPVCERCGEPIQDEYLYLINDEFVCQECLDRDFKKETDDYTEHHD